MNIAELTINGDNQFSDSVVVVNRFCFSLLSTSFIGTIVVQRSFDVGVTWRDVESFIDTSVEKNGEQPGGALYRFGCKTGSYTSGSIEGRLAATPV